MGGTGSREKADALSSSTSGCALIIFSNEMPGPRETPEAALRVSARRNRRQHSTLSPKRWNALSSMCVFHVSSVAAIKRVWLNTVGRQELL